MTVWLQDALGLDPLFARGLQLLVAFVFVVAAIFVLFAVLRRRARGRGVGPRSAQRRLGLVEALSVDDTRRLVLVRRDQVEHLLLIGGPSDVVVETAITRATARPAAGAPPRPPAVADVEPIAAPEPAPAAPARQPAAEPVFAPTPPPAPPAAPPAATVAPKAAEPVAAPPEPAPLRLAPERPAAPAPRPAPAPEPSLGEPRPRPAASLDLRPVRPSAPEVEPRAAPRPPLREILAPRLDPDPAARPADDTIRPERR